MTKRTVERDLADLSGIFPLRCNAVSKPYGWHWEAGARLDIPGMDLTEAFSLGLLEEVLRSLVPDSFTQGLEQRFRLAREKLAHLPGNPKARWSELVRYQPPGPAFLPPTVVPGILREVQDGLLQGRRLRASYRAAGKDEAREVELHPLALLQQGVRSYLIAAALGRDKPLAYALHRFEWVEAMPEQAKRPAGFTLDRFLQRGGGQFAEGGAIVLKARVSEELARLLEETPLSGDQRIAKGKNGCSLVATVFDSWQLRFWILSQGAAITVTQPASLRKEIVERIEEMREGYRSGLR